MKPTPFLLLLVPLLTGCFGVSYKIPIVFIGDSITARWSSYANFSEYGWVDKGIPGQTSNEIAQRFASDVIDLHPTSVHILAGTNDLYSGWVPHSTYSALSSMISQANAANIRVYMGTVPPWGQGAAAVGLDPNYTAHNQRVIQLNKWIESQSGVVVIDYHSLLVGSNGFYSPAMSDDGVHPNAAGYHVMTPAVLLQPSN
jgi:lysophospholipase L1-like esterase